MSWVYVSRDEANLIMRRNGPFADSRPAGVPFAGVVAWDDIKRLANNAIMCDWQHKDCGCACHERSR